MSRFILVAAILLSSLAVAQEKVNVSFEWSFATLTQTTKDWSLVPITRDTALHSGDQLKMMVHLNRECFVYVLHEGPGGEISLRFPYDLKQFASGYKVGVNYYIPKGRAWFKLDTTIGRETIYLLASTQRLLDLEALVAKYNDAPASKKPEISKSIVSEIRNVRRYYKSFTTIAERPISIGGNVRGMTKEPSSSFPDVAQIATEINANNFYGKTVTIDHK